MIAATILPLAGRRRAAGDRAGRDARAPRRRSSRSAPGIAQARLRRRPALEPGPDRLPGGPRGRHLHRPAAQAVRVLDRRRAASSTKLVAFLQGLDETNPWALGHRPAQPGHHPGPQAGRRRGRPASSSRSSSRSRCRSSSTSPRMACRSSACCRRGSRCRRSRRSTLVGHPAAVRGGASGISLVADRRHDLDVRRVRRRGPATRWTATRSSPASARPTWRPACSPASR